MTGPYSTAADTYWAAGWRGVLPLPAEKKKDPPRGYTGGSGVDPSYPDVRAWCDGREGTGNIGLRLPLDVIGIDVDAYDDKLGAETFAAAEKAHGKLPPTWRTTSRDDGISGIRLYRVPPGMAWEQIGDGIETIQRKHRYAVVWPSVHPEGRTYRWIDPSGLVSTVIPHIDELPSLPEAWVSAYVKGEAEDIPRGTMPVTLAAAWLAGLPGAQADPCKRMRESTTADSVALTNGMGSAHDLACQAVARFVRLAAEGHPGVLNMMGAVHRAFNDNVTNPRRRGSTRTNLDAEAEWRDLVVSAVNLVSADMPSAPSCNCDGQLTALVVPDRTREYVADLPTDGATALAPQIEAAGLDDGDDTPRTSWWPRDLEPVLSGREVEPPPTVLTRNDDQPLWYSGKINGLIGESESGKTWVALLAVAQELEAGNKVLYLDFEDAAPGIVGRLKALRCTDSDLSAGLNYCDPAESLHAAADNDLSELLQNRTYSLIVIDGFNAAMTLLGLDLMSNTDVTKFFQLLLRPLAKTGAAVAYIDHIGKNSNDDSKGGIGAQAKRAMTTGCVIKVKVGEPFGRGMTGRLGMVVDKDRAGHVRGSSGLGGRDAGTAELVSDLDSGSVVVTLHAPNTATRVERHNGKQTLLMERISDWLNGSPERTSLRAVRDAMGGRGDDADLALKSLVTKGYVARERVGSGYSHHLVKRFTLADEMATETPSDQSVSECVPSVSGTQGPRPSDDRVPVSHPYRWDTDTVNGGGSGTRSENKDRVRDSGTRSKETPPGGVSQCNGCSRETPNAIIATFNGYCAKCSRERGEFQ